MKKQKKPIVLLLLVVGLVGGVAWMNAPHGKEEIPPAPKTSTEEKPTDVAAGVSSALDAKPKPGAAPEMKPHGNGGQRPGPGLNPSMMKPDPTTFKPKPNASATSSQWFTDQAHKD